MEEVDFAEKKKLREITFDEIEPIENFPPINFVLGGSAIVPGYGLPEPFVGRIARLTAIANWEVVEYKGAQFLVALKK